MGLLTVLTMPISTLEMLMVIRLVISTSGPRQVVPMWWLKSLHDNAHRAQQEEDCHRKKRSGAT